MTPAQKTPLYQSIAQALRGDIAEGAYVPGARLPTEGRLAERFGVNRHTVRRALGVLADEGLVRSRRGAGTTVLDRPIDYRIGQRVRFRQNLLAAGRAPATKVLSVEVRAATSDDARLLKLPEGADVCAYDAIALANGTPVAVTHAKFPEHRLPGVAEALRSGHGVTDALWTVGVRDYVRASTRVSAEAAGPMQAVHLAADEGAPLLLTSSINTDEAGMPVEHGRTWFLTTRVTLTIDHGT
ncbi:MAG: phosphonate metabolism transcriptional regulator PhnF [Pseudomonadota bacterium]